jgi:hypothetical protein
LKESSYLAVSFCRFTHLELFGVMVLIPGALVIRDLGFFLLELHSSERDMLDMSPLAGFLLCCRLFSHLRKEAGVPLFDVAHGYSCSHCREAGLLTTAE